jgi:hypothetical protein
MSNALPRKNAENAGHCQSEPSAFMADPWTKQDRDPLTRSGFPNAAIK